MSKYDEFAFIHCKYEDHGGAEWVSIVEMQHDEFLFDIHATYFIKTNSEIPDILELGGYQDVECDIQLADPKLVKEMLDLIEERGFEWDGLWFKKK